MSRHAPAARRYTAWLRGVAQPGSALAWGARGREFESRRPDHARQGLAGLHLLTLLCFRHRGIPLGIPVGPACGLSAPLGVPDSDRGRSLRSYHEHELTVTSSCDGKPRELGRGSISRAAPSPAPCPYLIGRQRPSRPGLSMPVYRAQDDGRVPPPSRPSATTSSALEQPPKAQPGCRTAQRLEWRRTADAAPSAASLAHAVP